MIVVSDTSAITNLAAIQHLHLLSQLYNQVTIPEAVYRELADIAPPVLWNSRSSNSSLACSQTRREPLTR